MWPKSFVLLLAATLAAGPAAAQVAGAGSVRAQFAPAGSTLVVAHRACHAPAPRHDWREPLPENSLPGIDRCVALGVDVAEVDVRRTLDGYLVLMHDENVDRTTDGHGKVADLTLANIRALRLRRDEGGPDAPLTDAHVPTLKEALARAHGRIILNLDIQAGLHPDVIAAVDQAGQADGVIVKEPVGIGSPILTGVAPFDRVPFMPILSPAGDGSDLPALATRQTSRRPPVALELPRMTDATLPVLSGIALAHRTRLWVNTLWEGFVRGWGGDVDALRDPDAVWGRLKRAGVSVIQTDEPEALLRFLHR
ncbi:glycerophosphodiester phosphodiesterase family protein [Sphingomonas sp. 10B4]|uniref:glycerophosphodiester phosphodiesterase family protein n=1 Tax=Sphingomonas sp. 10B4 TaxID=3048575 RepID=UPI002AB554E9|nr:glycerophosphodiester phosphodiesterase family protein [Sphingomonas sp. 10B4]MDY7522835.1 glycerophosphodiester phosphodiesterase family protein [Sphingomonas sp. 10B4]MEB0284265.1 glycerophosphodiester phosphodiesterase family protein [Sphingomonas sp. 10B4]